MNRSFTQFLQFVLAGLDLLLLNIILFFSQLVFDGRISQEVLSEYYKYWMFLNVTWLGIAWVGGVYHEKHILSFESFSKQTTKIYLAWLAGIVVYLFFFRKFELSRIYIASTLTTFGFSLMLNRFTYLGLKDYFKRRDHLIRRIVIMGYNDVAKKLAFYLEQEGINTHIMGFSEDIDNVHELTHYPILGGRHNTIEISKQLEAHEIFSTITPEQDASVYSIMERAESECIKFRLVPDLNHFIRRPVHIEYLRDMPILSLRSEPLMDYGNRARKRALDFIISLFVVIFILSWLIPILGLLIYLESPGPIFFSQLRSGKNNKTFKCLKFRSMKVNNEADKKQATKNDSRITKIGRFIRRTSLDEFPQFINVLKGEMSLIGPRPHMVKHTEDYSKILGHFMVRQFLKPGITGWAQVNGYRGEIDDEEKLKKRVDFDIWYLEHWSFWLDVKILFLTIYNIFKGEENAY